MKRLLFLMLLCSPLFFTSCEENYYGITETYYTTVFPRDWYVPSTASDFGLPGYYVEAWVPLDAITPDVFDNGAVLVYASYGDADIQLPDVYADRVGSSDFVQIMGYQLVVGGLYITLEASDYQVEPPFDDVNIKVVLVR